MTTRSKLATTLLLIVSVFAPFTLLAVPSATHAQEIPLPPGQTTGPQSQSECPPGSVFEISTSGQTNCRPVGASVSSSATVGNKGPTTCEGWSDFFFSPVVCIGRSMGAFIASALITLSAKLLELSGLLFNWVVYYTLIAFGDAQNGFLTKGVLDAINLVWTVFRDISNILIIGIFAFIAISIILGLEKFGQKKLIANVLIVAILINFSLLFTKVIIDASNFTAFQFYKATNVVTQPDTTSNSGQLTQTASGAFVSSSFAQDGIAGSFIRFMGITTIGDTYSALQKGADKIDNGALVLLHGVFTATVLLAAALVLLYGSFLVVSRAILIVFLMITSSLAFASYLIPKAAESAYGWNTWWKSLINVAIFGPLLMMLLWATLTMAGALAPKGGTLGALLTNPQQAGNLSALFSYIVILGMLFGSFKIASAFSTHISGFNFAAMIPALGIAAGARVAAFAGRQTVGRASLAASDALKRRGADARDGSIAQSLYKFGAKGMKGVAKSDMNAMRSPLGNMLAKTSGLDAKTLAGKELKGFEGTLKARAAKYAEDADMLHVDAKKRAAIETEAIKNELSKNGALGSRHEQAERAATSEKSETKSAEIELQKAQEAKVRAEADLKRAKESGDESVKNSAEAALKSSEENIRTQTTRIKEATARLQNAETVMTKIKSEARAAAISKGNLKEYQSEGELAATIAHSRFTNTLARATGINTKDNDRLAQMAKKEVGDHHEKKEAKKIAEYLKEKTGGGHGAHEEPKPSAKPVAHAPEPSKDGGDHGGGGGHGAHH